MRCKHCRYYILGKIGVLETFLTVVIVFFIIQSVIIIWSSYNSEILAGYSKEFNSFHKGSLEPTALTQGPCYKNVTVDLGRDLDSLLAQVSGHPDWTWLASRIYQQWPLWQNNLRSLQLGVYRQRRILVVPGLLIGTDFGRNSSLHGGGPMGDLVQWADLILALHVLAHRVTLLRNIYVAARGIRYEHFAERFSPGCPSLPYDLIYTDIITLKALPADVIEKARCEIRVLDAYGTEAMYNAKDYAIKHGYLSSYGQLNLNLKQFLTFYPHTPDNSFLGFAVPPADVTPNKQKLSIGLLYGKKPEYFLAHQDYIKYLMNYMAIHSTVSNTSTLPEGVHHHGVVSSLQYKQLLHKAKFLIGVGEPLESTGVMEALSHGCIFLNPRFHGADRDKLQTMNKPTSRKLSSQVPYLENVGEPHIVTVNMNNLTEIHRAITTAKQVSGYIPPLFTLESFVRRLQWMMEHDDVCGEVADRDVHVIQGNYGESCTQACHRDGHVCDPGLFTALRMDMFKPHCQKIVKPREESIHYPARTKDGKCLPPRSKALFSCAGQHEVLQRLCACRRHNKLIDS